MRDLVRLVLGADGEVRDDVAAFLLERLRRSQLKEFLGALTRALKRLSVAVQVAGETEPAGVTVARRYPGRPVSVTTDDSLGAGLRVRAGDDIVDASVRGYIRKIIAELGGT